MSVLVTMVLVSRLTFPRERFRCRRTRGGGAARSAFPRERSRFGSVVDTHGEVLALGRTRRFVSRARRRALMIREGMRHFPGCHQIRNLQSHRIAAWVQRWTDPDPDNDKDNDKDEDNDNDEDNDEDEWEAA